MRECALRSCLRTMTSAEACWPVIFSVIFVNMILVHGGPLEIAPKDEGYSDPSTAPMLEDDFGTTLQPSPSSWQNIPFAAHENAESAAQMGNITLLDSLIRLFKRQAIFSSSSSASARIDDGGWAAKAAFLAAGPAPDQFPHHAIVTSTQRSFGLRVQKATERTTTQPTTPRRTRPPPLYPDRNSIREFHPPSTVSGEGVCPENPHQLLGATSSAGPVDPSSYCDVPSTFLHTVGSVQVIRVYGNSQSSRSSSLPSLVATGSYLPTLFSTLIITLALMWT